MIAPVELAGPLLPSLAVSPSAEYRRFIICLEALAATKCTDHYPAEGLSALFVHLTADQYLLLDRQDANGDAIPKPTLPTLPTMFGNNAGDALRKVYDNNLLLYRDVTTGVAELRSAVISACGETILEELRAAAAEANQSLAKYSLANILEFLAKEYGTPTKEDFIAMHDFFESGCPSIAELRQWLARLQVHFKTLSSAGQPKSTLDQLSILEHGIRHFPRLMEFFQEYESAHPVFSSRNFKDAADFLKVHASRYDTSSSAGYAAAAVSTDAVRKDKRERVRPGRGRGSGRQTIRVQRKYCFEHGY
jgi:hypothetical protein